MNIQGQSQKYGHLIVAGGTIIALIGFLFLPYVTMSPTAASSSSAPAPGISSLPFTMSAIQAASYQGFTWFEALLAAGILLIALLLAYSRNPFGMSKVALDKQVQRGVYAIIGISVVSLLLQYVLMASIPGASVSMSANTVSTNAPGATIPPGPSANGFAMGYNIGSWFYVVGMLAVIGGAVYALMQMRPAQVSPSSSYMPPTQYSQNQQPPSAPTYQDPAQSQPTQLSQGQYPNQQQWQQPQPPINYPPTQQAWQQPPQPQQPQQPYPPSFPGQ